MVLDRGKPRGLFRHLLRSPIVLYRLALGWVFGARFLLLTHTGRISGETRRTVIEVMRRDPDSGACMVAAAWGEKSDWFRNIRRQPAVRVTLGTTSFAARAELLGEAEATEEFTSYADRYPKAWAALTRLLTGEMLPASPEASRTLAASIPVVAFVPTGGTSSPPRR